MTPEELVIAYPTILSEPLRLRQAAVLAIAVDEGLHERFAIVDDPDWVVGADSGCDGWIDGRLGCGCRAVRHRHHLGDRWTHRAAGRSRRRGGDRQPDLGAPLATAPRPRAWRTRHNRGPAQRVANHLTGGGDHGPAGP